MTRPTISFLLPTHREDRPLPRALWSIVPQLLDGDEVIVCGDVVDGPLPLVEQVCAIFRDKGHNVQYLPYDAGHHCWGHEQLNWGMQHAVGDYIHCSDDDDIWTTNAAQHIRVAAEENPGRPLLFRFLSYFGTVYWEAEGMVARNHIGGHCLVQPNVKGKLGTFSCDYSGDFDYIRRCLDLHGGNDSAVWVDQLVNIARPVAVGAKA